MLDAHAYAMQVKLCKANTRGVTQAPLVEEPTQELVRGIPEPMLMKGEEGDDLIGLGLWNNFPWRRSPPMHHLLRWEQPLLGEGGQHLLIHIGRPLIRHRALDL